jgi:hypothetical protein
MHPILDTDTRNALRRVLNEATKALPEPHRTQQRKAALAFHILKLAAEGERDPERLRRRAIAETEDVVVEAEPLRREPPSRRCASCGAMMRLVFRASNPFREERSEILEYHCTECPQRTTMRWSPGRADQPFA